MAADIRVNLTARIAEAEREGWHGEAEGLKVSLPAAEAKPTQIDGLIARRRDAVSLGMPTFLTSPGALPPPQKSDDDLTLHTSRRTPCPWQAFAASKPPPNSS
jgi:hypothetical protein